MNKYNLNNLNLKDMQKIDKCGGWQEHFVCDKCGYVISNKMWALRFSILGVQLYFLEECLNCNDKKDIEPIIDQMFDDSESNDYIKNTGWAHVKLRFIPNSVWYNPRSWGKGYWEVK